MAFQSNSSPAGTKSFWTKQIRGLGRVAVGLHPELDSIGGGWRRSSWKPERGYAYRFSQRFEMRGTEGWAWIKRIVEGSPTMGNIAGPCGCLTQLHVTPPVSREEFLKDGSLWFLVRINNTRKLKLLQVMVSYERKLKLKQLKVFWAAPIRSSTKDGSSGKKREFFFPRPFGFERSRIGKRRAAGDLKLG